jgi:hypothetical protein
MSVDGIYAVNPMFASREEERKLFADILVLKMIFIFL